MASRPQHVAPPQGPPAPGAGERGNNLQSVSPSPSTKSLHSTVSAAPSISSTCTTTPSALVVLLENGDWNGAESRLRTHPAEARLWASIRSKGSSSSSRSGGAKRLPLHHACLKLRHVRTLTQKRNAAELIGSLLVAYPEAARSRESRHGCLPLHLASFSVSSSGSGGGGGGRQQQQQKVASSPVSVIPSSPTGDRTSNDGGGNNTPSSPPTPQEDRQHHQPQQVFSMTPAVSSNAVEIKLTASYSFSSSVGTNEDGSGSNHGEHHSAHTGDHTNGSSTLGGLSHVLHGEAIRVPPPRSSPITNSRAEQQQKSVAATEEEEEFDQEQSDRLSVQIIDSILRAYPKAAKTDSEGGRLPLHMACSGRATPPVIHTLVRAYPDACRHRNRDGFLPLHLAAYWGVSDPQVAACLLRAYPDAAVGRNKWGRIPLEEALHVAGENGRANQDGLIRVLRKHPSYWTRLPPSQHQHQHQHQVQHQNQAQGQQQQGGGRPATLERRSVTVAPVSASTATNTTTPTPVGVTAKPRALALSHRSASVGANAHHHTQQVVVGRPGGAASGPGPGPGPGRTPPRHTRNRSCLPAMEGNTPERVAGIIAEASASAASNGDGGFGLSTPSGGTGTSGSHLTEGSSPDRWSIPSTGGSGGSGSGTGSGASSPHRRGASCPSESELREVFGSFAFDYGDGGDRQHGGDDVDADGDDGGDEGGGGGAAAFTEPHNFGSHIRPKNGSQPGNATPTPGGSGNPRQDFADFKNFGGFPASSGGPRPAGGNDKNHGNNPNRSNPSVALSSESGGSDKSLLTESTELNVLIKAKEWTAVERRCDRYPAETSEWLTVKSNAGRITRCSPLHYALERDPPVDAVRAVLTAHPDACSWRASPGGQLPLHVACTWTASPRVVRLLLSAYPRAAMERDECGNLPVHDACFAGAPAVVVEELLEAYPGSISVANGSGSAPLDIVRRLSHSNKVEMLSMLEKYLAAWKDSKRRESAAANAANVAAATEAATSGKERKGSGGAGKARGASRRLFRSGSRRGGFPDFV